MSPELYQQVTSLYDEVSKYAAAERVALLDERCHGDIELHREVEKLLAAKEKCDSDFLNESAWEIEARHRAQSDPFGQFGQPGQSDQSLVAGNTLAQFAILAPLGAGAMGEVYLAHDTRLNRKVALKVLPLHFTSDASRVRRFEREARTASALNHQNIITIYDFGQTETAAGTRYFMSTEYVEGITLRARLQKGPLPFEEARTSALQIAAALMTAHAAGITHRDIKPENVMVRRDGMVKVLDFGLAKLAERNSVTEREKSVVSSSLTTTPGVVLGTVAYMSPEQVRGEEVDHRSDLFSFGVLLFEMLQGQRPFQRATTAETMAAILHDEPPELSATNVRVTPSLEKIVRRCLEKQPERRFHSAHDLGFALETLMTTNSSGAPYAEATQASDTAMKRSGWRGRLAWLGVPVMTALALALGVSYARRQTQEVKPLRFAINPPERAALFDWPTLSPDGRTLAFIAEVDGKTQLWVRSLEATTARPLVAIRDNLPAPFWSPDNQFIAYFEQSKLKKIALTGSAAETLPEILCDSPGQTSGSWSRDGLILFGNGPTGLSRVSANGGAVTACTTVDTARGELGHSAPAFLPDGRHFVYWVSHRDTTQSGLYLAALAGGEPRLLLSGLSARNIGMALPVAGQRAGQGDGYLTFVRQGALLAQDFDYSRNELVGDPIRIADYVPAPVIALAHFSLATNGVLVLQENEPQQQLTWFDRSGHKLGTMGSGGQYSFPRLSPDGRRLAVGHATSPLQLDDVYLFELASGVGTPFTFDPSQDLLPLWSPDGSQLVWVSPREGVTHVFHKAASGAGQDEVLLRSAFYKSVCDWSADGRFILYEELNPQTAHDLWLLPLEGERRPWAWLKTSAAEMAARFSPDGKWIAYQSNESGRPEIYVQAFTPGATAASGKRQLSLNGGSAPRWRRDGRELYYLAGDGKLMAVAITPGSALQFGAAHALFAPSGLQVNADRGYTLTGDGQRFLFVTRAADAVVPPFTVVLNWMAKLKD